MSTNYRSLDQILGISPLGGMLSPAGFGGKNSLDLSKYSTQAGLQYLQQQNEAYNKNLPTSTYRGPIAGFPQLQPRPTDIEQIKQGLLASLKKPTVSAGGFGNFGLVSNKNQTDDQLLNNYFTRLGREGQDVGSDFSFMDYTGPDAGQRSAAIRGIAQNLATKDYYGSWDPGLQFLTSAQVAGKKTGGGDIQALVNQLNQLVTQNPQYKLGNKAGNNMKQIERLAPDLARYGVQSLSDIKSYQVPSPNGKGTQTVFYNTRNNMVLPTEFGSSMKGEGGSYYSLVGLPNGGAIPVSRWTDTSEAADWAPAVAMLTAFAAPAALGALGAAGMSSAAAGATYGAGTGALTSAVSGGDPWKGALVGGLTGGIGGGIGSNVGGGQYNLGQSLGFTDPMAQNIVNKAISGGLNSAIKTGASGGDPGNALLGGALSGGLGGAFGAGGKLLGGALSKALFNNQGQSSPARPTAPLVPTSQSTSGLGSANMGPLARLAQARRDISASGLGGMQKENLLGGLGRLENTGRGRFGWKT